MTQQAGVPKVPVIAIKPQTNLYHVYFTEGGALPKNLKGLFVSRKDAETQLNIWLNANNTGKVKS